MGASLNLDSVNISALLEWGLSSNSPTPSHAESQQKEKRPQHPLADIKGLRIDDLGPQRLSRDPEKRQNTEKRWAGKIKPKTTSPNTLHPRRTQKQHKDPTSLENSKGTGPVAKGERVGYEGTLQKAIENNLAASSRDPDQLSDQMRDMDLGTGCQRKGDD